MSQRDEKTELVWELVQHYVRHQWTLRSNQDGLNISIQCPLCVWGMEMPAVSQGKGFARVDKCIIRDKLRRHMRRVHALGEVQDYLLAKAMEE